jgi:hypothetical protein
MLPEDLSFTRRRRRRRLLIALTSIVVVCGGGLAVFLASARVCLDESLYTRPGHFAYYACVSSVIRNAPRVMPVDEPTFFASAGDGPKPPQDEITYMSRAAPSEVIATTAHYLSSVGFSRADPSGPASSSTALMRGSGSSVTITALPKGASACEVRVSQTFD